MRILLVHGWHPVEGGSEAYFRWIREALRERGDDARLLVGTAGSAAGGTADYEAWATTNPVAQSVVQLANPWAAAVVGRAVREHRPDVALVGVFANFLSPSVFAPLRDVPVVLSVTDYKVVCPVATKLLPDGTICRERHGRVCLGEGCTGPLRWLRDRVRYPLLEGAVAKADVVLALGRGLQTTLADNGIPARYLEWPVRPPPSELARAPAPGPRFLYVGRLAREKGVLELVRAFARVVAEHPDATLRMAGSGPAEADVRAAVAAAGLGARVELLGWTSPDALEAEFARAWALVAPSLWAEPLGLVAVEAIVRGVPVVASETGGFAETVGPDAGRLVPNGDVDALARALSAVADGSVFPEHSLPEAVRRAAAARHDLGAHVEALRAVLAEAAGDAAPGRPTSSE